MTRRTLFSMLVAIVAMVLAITGGASIAQAQCCTFTVDVSCNLDATCLPITIKTRWSGGGAVNTQTDVVTACGPNVFPVTAVPCPATLQGYSLNGSAPIPFSATQTQVFLIPGACCVYTWGTLDANGCPVIHIIPC